MYRGRSVIRLVEKTRVPAKMPSMYASRVLAGALYVIATYDHLFRSVALKVTLFAPYTSKVYSVLFWNSSHDPVPASPCPTIA